jgi:hypothetical protein
MKSTTPSHERSHNVFFHQGCPVCGRRLEINVALLGRRVYCQHCGGGFVALDESLGGTPVANAVSDTALKVDALLERAALVLEQAADGTERVRT